ncbi:hypothetical protein D3C75_999190 [compost metagenome]
MAADPVLRPQLGKGFIIKVPFPGKAVHNLSDPLRLVFLFFQVETDLLLRARPSADKADRLQIRLMPFIIRHNFTNGSSVNRFPLQKPVADHNILMHGKGKYPVNKQVVPLLVALLPFHRGDPPSGGFLIGHIRLRSLSARRAPCYPGCPCRFVSIATHAAAMRGTEDR